MNNDVGGGNDDILDWDDCTASSHLKYCIILNMLRQQIDKSAT